MTLGFPYAALSSYAGSRTIMVEWLRDDDCGQEFATHFNTEASVEKIRQQLAFHDLPVSSKNLSWVFERLRDSGQLAEPETAAVPVPDVPRGKDGRPLTSSQLEWRNFAIWANDPHLTQQSGHRPRETPVKSKFQKVLRRESQARNVSAKFDGAVTPDQWRDETNQRSVLAVAVGEIRHKENSMTKYGKDAAVASRIASQEWASGFAAGVLHYLLRFRVPSIRALFGHFATTTHGDEPITYADLSRAFLSLVDRNVIVQEFHSELGRCEGTKEMRTLGLENKRQQEDHHKQHR